jgi:hypothetical protein
MKYCIQYVQYSCTVVHKLCVGTVLNVCKNQKKLFSLQMADLQYTQWCVIVIFALVSITRILFFVLCKVY